MSTSSPNPGTAMLWFIIITSIYFVIKYNTDGKNIIYFGIYAILLIIGEYFINLTLTNSICGSSIIYYPYSLGFYIRYS